MKDLEKKFFAYMKNKYGVEPDHDEYAKMSLAKSSYIDGYLQRDKELREAWPSDNQVSQMAEQQKFGEFTAFISACDWLRDKLLGKVSE